MRHPYYSEYGRTCVIDRPSLWGKVENGHIEVYARSRKCDDVGVYKSYEDDINLLVIRLGTGQCLGVFRETLIAATPDEEGRVRFDICDVTLLETYPKPVPRRLVEHLLVD